MDLFPCTDMVRVCMGQRIGHGVESFCICPVLSEVYCALNTGIGKRTCFSCCTELREKQSAENTDLK